MRSLAISAGVLAAAFMLAGCSSGAESPRVSEARTAVDEFDPSAADSVLCAIYLNGSNDPAGPNAVRTTAAYRASFSDVRELSRELEGEVNPMAEDAKGASLPGDTEMLVCGADFDGDDVLVYHLPGDPTIWWEVGTLA